jgi:hypothetical protein
MDLPHPPLAAATDWPRRLQVLGVVMAGTLALAALALHVLPLRAVH